MFCVDLRTNSDYFSIQHYLTGFYNRDENCFLCGTNWVFKLDRYSFVLKWIQTTFSEIIKIACNQMLQYNGRIAKRNLFMISRSPVAAPSKAWVCSRLFIGIKGSKLAGGHRCLSLVTVLFCVGLITRPEDTYRVLCALSFIVEPRRGNLGLIQQVCRAVRKKMPPLFGFVL